MIIKYEYNLFGKDDNHSAYFTVDGREGEYSVTIHFTYIQCFIQPSNCTCPFGSSFAFSKENIAQKKICKHLKECLDLLIHLKHIKTWEYAI